MAVGEQNRSAIIKRASLIALFGNLVLAVMKIAAGLHSGSLAVVGDGIDTSIDVLVSGMTLFVAGVSGQPADADHPWGHGRAETLATAILSMMLFFAGAQLVLSSIHNLVSGVTEEVPGLAAFIVTGASIAGKLLLALNQYIVGKKTNSGMLAANAKNMAGDVAISVGVLLGLFFSQWFEIGAIDSITAILVGAWVIWAAIGIFREVNSELMDGGSLPEQYRVVFEAVRSVPGAGNPHRTRMRRVAGLWDIDIDIEVDAELSVREAHEIATRVEKEIRVRLECVFDIMVHVEPAGDSANMENEAYGLQEHDV
jgi:cation diffusion facilitator family transporter